MTVDFLRSMLGWAWCGDKAHNREIPAAPFQPFLGHENRLGKHSAAGHRMRCTGLSWVPWFMGPLNPDPWKRTVGLGTDGEGFVENNVTIEAQTAFIAIEESRSPLEHTQHFHSRTVACANVERGFGPRQGDRAFGDRSQRSPKHLFQQLGLVYSTLAMRSGTWIVSHPKAKSRGPPEGEESSWRQYEVRNSVWVAEALDRNSKVPPVGTLESSGATKGIYGGHDGAFALSHFPTGQEELHPIGHVGLAASLISSADPEASIPRLCGSASTFSATFARRPWAAFLSSRPPRRGYLCRKPGI